MRCAVCNEVRKVLTCSVAAGIVDQVTSTISNAVNYVSETVQGKSAEAEKEGNKESAFLLLFRLGPAIPDSFAFAVAVRCSVLMF